jgi:hypothetical protein
MREGTLIGRRISARTPIRAVDSIPDSGLLKRRGDAAGSCLRMRTRRGFLTRGIAVHFKRARET